MKQIIPPGYKRLAEFPALDYWWIFGQAKKTMRLYFFLFAKQDGWGKYEKNPIFVYEFSPLVGVNDISEAMGLKK